MSQMADHCHNGVTGVELADCEDMNCVFCGFTVQFKPPSVLLTISHILYVTEPSFPAPPRSEHPVELRPPITPFSA